MTWIFAFVGCQQPYQPCPTEPKVDDGGEVLPELGRTGDEIIAAFVPTTLQFVWDAPGPLPERVQLIHPVFGWATTSECQLDWYNIGVGMNTDVSDELAVLQLDVRADGTLSRTFHGPLSDPDILAWVETTTGVMQPELELQIRDERVELRLFDAAGQGLLAPAESPDSFRGAATW